MSLIEIRNLTTRLGGAIVLNNVSLNVEEKEVIGIIGHSGAGKSTLLRSINRLETPLLGSVVVDGQNACTPEADLAALRRRVGMVFKTPNLFPHKMAVENVMLPQQSLLGKSTAEAYEEAVCQLKRVGLAGRERQYPDELSDGQRQRVAIARALAMHPKVLLFDEPVDALDATMASEVLSVIRNLAASGLTMLIATHKMQLARNVATRVLFMDRGSIYEEGTPEQIFERPMRDRTRSFIFRVKSWEQTLSRDCQDIYQMLAELEEFCSRQFMDRKETVNCQLAVEELATSVILPGLDRNPNGSVRMILYTGEAGIERKLVVDCTDFPELEALCREPSNEMSGAILNNLAKLLPQERLGEVAYQIL